MSNVGTRGELNALLDRIEQDAFRRGWEAAVQHIVSSAANAPKADIAITSTSHSVEFKPHRSSYGIVPALVRELLDEVGERGIRPADVVARGRQRGEEIAESSVRQRLRKMRLTREVRSEGGRWFRTRAPQAGAGTESGDVAASPPDELELDDGGFHAAA